MKKQKPLWAQMLVSAREEEGYSSEELAAALDLRPPTIRGAEAGYECSGVMKKLHEALPNIIRIGQVKAGRQQKSIVPMQLRAERQVTKAGSGL